MKANAEGTIEVPPQPGPAVQETAFAASSSSTSLTLLDSEPIPDEIEDPATARNGYGSIRRISSTTSSQTIKPKPPSAARAIAPDLLRGLLMVFMSLDHNAMALHSWPHGTAVDGENDSGPVQEWNRPLALTMRLLTHLCAPGFTFLLGMGVVYFGRSRTNLGWSAGQMVRHFAVRAVVLTMVSVAMGLIMSGGKIWFFNIVLFALAVDYLLAGLLWMAVARTEKGLGYLLLKVLPRAGDEGREPLLSERRGEDRLDIAPDRAIIRAADVSWHIHNALLLGLAAVAIWWNVWLSPTGGHCGVEPRWDKPESVWIQIWFWPVMGSMTDRVVSGFPPMAWLSFAILGLLYGRVVLARSWSTKAINVANAAAGAAFSLVFVLTRLFHFGNLSEGCLHMPEHVAHPEGNQYLASVASFFYLVKYPPDVAFWSLTMGVNFFLLALFGSIPPAAAKRVFHVLLVYGTSALFFYVAHIFLLFFTGSWMVALVGHTLDSKDPWTGAPGTGVDQVWAIFANLGLGLAILYPSCRWYGAFKRTKGPDSLWRFF